MSALVGSVHAAHALLDVVAVLDDQPNTPLRDLAWNTLAEQRMTVTHTENGWEADPGVILVPALVLIHGLISTLVAETGLSREDVFAGLRDRADQLD